MTGTPPRCASTTLPHLPSPALALCPLPTSHLTSCAPPLLQVHRLSRQANEPSRFFAVDGHAAPLSQDWRVFRAQLVAQEQGGSAPSAGLNTLVHPCDEWAHLISKPEQGCLLVARHASLGMFTHSVLLVSEHGELLISNTSHKSSAALPPLRCRYPSAPLPSRAVLAAHMLYLRQYSHLLHRFPCVLFSSQPAESEEGTSALILNTATPMNIACLGLEEWTTAAFGDNTLFLGGPMNKNLLHVLHGRPEVEGAMRILQGVYAGGVDSAIELVRSGDAPASDFRLLAGYSGWGPHQLEREVEDGAWWVVAASPALIHACLRGECSSLWFGF